MLAFSNKTKIVTAFVPEKVTIYLKSFFKNEITFFEKKYKFKINIIPDNTLVIPEYKIHLFNKNKKIINQIENFKKIDQKFQKNNNVVNINSRNKTKDLENFQKNKKQISKGLGKTLWVRRKKRKSN